MAEVIVVSTTKSGEVGLEVKTFDKDTPIYDILHLASDFWGFKIPKEEDRNLWNNIIDLEWAGLDDSDYYSYSKPIVANDKWNCCINGYFEDLDNVIYYYKCGVETFSKIKRLGGS